MCQARSARFLLLFSAWRAHSILRAQDQKLFSPQLRRIPTHAGVLRETENVAARAVVQNVFGQRQTAGWAVRLGLNLVNVRGMIRQNVVTRIHAAIQAASLQQTKEKFPSAAPGQAGGDFSRNDSFAPDGTRKG